MYADEYGGFGSGFTNQNFRVGQGQPGRFENRGNRFAEKNLNREGNRSRASGTRDSYIDPWAHNGSNSNNQIGSNFGGTFNDSNNFMNNNANNANGSTIIEMENKSSTQVTIPKDVSITRYYGLKFLETYFIFHTFHKARWCYNR